MVKGDLEGASRLARGDASRRNGRNLHGHAKVPDCWQGAGDRLPACRQGCSVAWEDAAVA